MEWILATIAALGVLIAYFQWRTAHERVVLDLFDRRFQVYEDLRNSLVPIIGHGKPSPADERAFLEALQRAKFLFGDDVNRYLEGVWDDICHLYFPEPNDPEEYKARQRHFRNVSDFGKNARKLFIPYMRLDQKLPGFWLPGHIRALLRS